MKKTIKFPLVATLISFAGSIIPNQEAPAFYPPSKARIEAFRQEVTIPTAKVMAELVREKVDKKIKDNGEIDQFSERNLFNTLRLANLIELYPDEFVNINLRGSLLPKNFTFAKEFIPVVPRLISAENLLNIANNTDVPPTDYSSNENLKHSEKDPYYEVQEKASNAYRMAYISFLKRHGHSDKDIEENSFRYFSYEKKMPDNMGWQFFKPDSRESRYYHGGIKLFQLKNAANVDYDTGRYFFFAHYNTAVLESGQQLAKLKKRAEEERNSSSWRRFFSPMEPTINLPSIGNRISAWFKSTFMPNRQSIKTIATNMAEPSDEAKRNFARSQGEGSGYMPRTYQSPALFNWMSRKYQPVAQQTKEALIRTHTPSYKHGDSAEKAMKRMENTGMGYQ